MSNQKKSSQQILLEDNWESLLTRIRQDADMTDIAYHTWLEPLKVHDLRDGVVIVCVPSDNRIVLSYIEGHYQNFFVVTLSEFLNETVGVRFVMEKELIYNKEETPQNGDIKEPQPPVTAPHPIMEGANLNPKYRFDTFVVGSNNKFAHQASLAVAESPGEAYNPLFLYGGPGLGKTHLMHAIGHFILENRPGTKILYVTSENFTNEVISSIRSGKQEQMARLRDKYRTVDVLMIDDIQFIIGKDSTQEEFFHTFNELHQSGKQIILSSDRPPREMETLEERFRSRFSMGLVADVQVPDYETRMAILQKNDETRLADQKTNENNDAEINNAIFDYIAENVTTSIRDLEGAYNKVIAHARMNNIPYESFTLEDAQEALKDVITSDEHRIITIPLILTTVCNFYGINEEELLSRRRTSDVVMPRQVAMYLCRILTDESLDKIGESLGGKDHTTVINGINRIKSSVDTNSELSKAIEQIRKKLGA